MTLFDFIHRSIVPKRVIERQRQLISALKISNPNFIIIVESDEKVLLSLPAFNEESSILIQLMQNFSSEDSTKRKTLYVNYASTYKDEPVNVCLSFVDSTAPVTIVSALTAAIKERSNKIQKKMDRIEYLKKARRDIENSTQKELTEEQKYIFIYLLNKYTSRNSEYCQYYKTLYNLRESNLLYSYKTELIHRREWSNLCSFNKKKQEIYTPILEVRNRKAIETFITYCCESAYFSQQESYKKEFTSILTEWGFTEYEIVGKIISARCLNLPDYIFPLSPIELSSLSVKCSSISIESLAEQIKKKDNNVNIQTLELQRKEKYNNINTWALTGIAMSFCNPFYISQERDKAEEIVAAFIAEFNICWTFLEHLSISQTHQDRINYINSIAKIKDDNILMEFTDTCLSLVKLGNSKALIYFVKLLSQIGYDESEINEIKKGHHVYKYKKEEIKVVFVKDWQLRSFVKTFDYKTMQVGSLENHTSNREYRVCVFIRIDGTKSYASFLPDLGELSLQEIANRKDELYIGETSEGNYFLYSKDCKGWKIEEPTKTLPPFNESTVEIQEICNTLYNGDTDDEISLLTVEQKIALFSLLVFLGSSSTLEDKKDEVADTVRDFESTIKPYEENVGGNTFNEITSDRNKCIALVKTIHMDTPLIEFILACDSLKDISDNSPFFLYEYEHLLLDIGFSKEDVEDIKRGKYNYRFKE